MHVTQVATVMVSVSDQDRAVAFFVDALGFEPRADFEYAGGERWVEVAPPGATSQITLVQQRERRPAGIETGVAFVTDDVEADHAALRARGVDVDDAILREGDPPGAGGVLAGIPPMFRVRDWDGNSFLLVARASASTG